MTELLATGHAAFFGGLLALGARLGDKYGPRRILLIGIVTFTAVTVVAVTAQEIVQLLARRGLGGAIDCNWWPEPAYAAVRASLDSGPTPTALICLNDRIAFGAHQAAAEVGLRVPRTCRSSRSTTPTWPRGCARR